MKSIFIDTYLVGYFLIYVGVLHTHYRRESVNNL